MLKIIALLLLTAPCIAAAQTIYKCKGPSGGTVYSQTPCATDAQEITVKTHTPKAEDVAAGQRRTQDMTLDNEGTDIGRRESACLAGIYDSITRPSDNRIRDMERRIAFLDREMLRSNNNLAGAQRDTGLQSEIAGLHQSIATERAGASQAAASQRSVCADRRRDAEDRLRRKREAAAEAREDP